MIPTEKIQSLLSNLVAPDAYNDVELTEQEQELALMEARQKKHGVLRSQEYKLKLLSEPEMRKYKAEELYQAIHDLKFTFDDTNKKIIFELCLYFTGDERAKSDPKKGILLYGPIGCGKTSLMNFFRHNQSNSFAIFSTRDIASEFAKHGDDGINRYKGLIPSSDYYKTFGQKTIGACFDDLGTEVDRKNWGNDSNVMSEILLSRYDKNNFMLGKTHATTNLSMDAIQERYGERVRSRLREMVTLIAFPDSAPDRR